MPEGISKVLIDPETGLLAREGSSTGIWEYFSDESVPTEYAPLIGLESEIAGEKTITEDEVPEALF